MNIFDILLYKINGIQTISPRKQAAQLKLIWDVRRVDVWT